MHNLTFYRQKRQDGGMRTAITVDDDHVFHQFQPGDEDPPDPALLWFVDVRCEGKALPTAPDAVLNWFRKHAKIIKDAMTEFAEKLRAGLDVTAWPEHWTVRKPPRGVTIELYCSAVRRVALLELANIWHEVRDQFESILDQLAEARSLPA